MKRLLALILALVCALASAQTSSPTTPARGVTEGTCTSAITFGGGSTGITYNGQLCQYSKVGNLATVNIRVILSAVGSSTGTMLVTGLPFTVRNTSGFHQGCAIYATGLASGVLSVQAVASANTTTVAVYKFTAGTATAMANTDATASTDFIITCSYLV